MDENKAILKDFYKAWLDWYNNGAEQFKPFYRELDLVGCLNRWYRARYNNEEALKNLRLSMMDDIRQAGNTGIFPLDVKETTRAERYNSPKRVEWVKAHALAA